MGIRPVGGSPSTIKAMHTESEALVKETAYKASSGKLTACGATDTPIAVSGQKSAAASTHAKIYEYYRTDNQVFDFDVDDASPGRFFITPTGSGASNGTTIADTKRTETSDALIGGLCYLHGVAGPKDDGNTYGNGQIRFISDNVQNTSLTVSPGFMDSEGNAYQVTTADRYSIVQWSLDDTAIQLNSSGNGLAADSAVTSGSVMPVDLPDFTRAMDGLVTQRGRFNI